MEGPNFFSLVLQMCEVLVKMSHFSSLMTQTIQQWNLRRTLNCLSDVLLLAVAQLYTGRCHRKDKETTKTEIRVSTKAEFIQAESQALSQLLII